MDAKFVDDDPSLYFGNVLFVIPGDPVCTSVLNVINTSPFRDHVFVQDASQLQPDARPSWLTGVPALQVRNPFNLVLGARRVSAFVQAWQNDAPQGVGAAGLTGASLLDDTSLFTLEGENTQQSTRTHTRQQTVGRAAPAAARHHNGGSCDGRVEEMKQQRASVDRRVEARGYRQGVSHYPRENMRESDSSQNVPHYY